MVLIREVADHTELTLPFTRDGAPKSLRTAHHKAGTKKALRMSAGALVKFGVLIPTTDFAVVHSQYYNLKQMSNDTNWAQIWAQF